MFRRKVAPDLTVVCRVPTGPGGSSIEPALDERWPEFDKLRWQAAVVSLDSGVKVTVEHADCSGLGRGPHYDVRYSRGVSGPFTFTKALTFLTGFGVGADTVERIVGEGLADLEWDIQS